MTIWEKLSNLTPEQQDRLISVAIAGSCITFEFECDGATKSITLCQKTGESYDDFLDRAFQELQQTMDDC